MVWWWNDGGIIKHESGGVKVFVFLFVYLLISCKVWDDAHLLVNGVVMFKVWGNGVIWQIYGRVLKMNRNLLKGMIKIFMIPC